MPSSITTTLLAVAAIATTLSATAAVVIAGVAFVWEALVAWAASVE